LVKLSLDILEKIKNINEITLLTILIESPFHHAISKDQFLISSHLPSNPPPRLRSACQVLFLHPQNRLRQHRQTDGKSATSKLLLLILKASSILCLIILYSLNKQVRNKYGWSAKHKSIIFFCGATDDRNIFDIIDLK